MISDPVAAKFALLAMYAEDMFKPGPPNLAPNIDQRCSQDLTLRGHLVAKNALFGGQKVKLGDNAYFGFVATRTNDPSSWVVVVRGTESTVEWLENFEGLLIDRSQVGWVEQGFDSIYCSMTYVPLGQPPQASTAASAIAATLPGGVTVTVVGHSLGAALASYLMLDLAAIPHRAYGVKGMLFACPRAGGGSFVQRVDHVVDDYMVYNYMRDLVPHVPPSLPLPINFESFPKTTWIRAADAQVVVRNDPVCNHHAYCYAAMLDAASVAITPQTDCIAAKPRQ